MKESLTLYEITEEIKAMDNLIEADYGELTEDHEQLIESISQLVRSKTDACVGYLNREEDFITLAKNRIKELQNFVKAKENKINRYKRYIKECLEKTKETSFKGVLNEIKFRKPAKVLLIEDDKNIPPEFIVVETTTKIEKKELLKAVKNGLKIDGVRAVDGNKNLIFKLRSANE